MIKTALVFIRQHLDQYLKNKFMLDESVVVLNHLLDADGGLPKKNKNKMVVTLINLDRETSKQYAGNQQRMQNGRMVKINPAINFNVDLLFTASFDDYGEALKFLNATICFFQSNPSLNAKSTPDIPVNIKKLNIEIENSSYAEIHNLWSAMGAKYQPSIICKIRHVSIQSDEIAAINMPVYDVDTELVP
ncbi:MAG: DUF4255 domain-containing protein [Gammaproteobacteria bacterium]|nr:DUF4255 domain-containing protein [Gammaproteobacteria bacterium]